MTEEKRGGLHLGTDSVGGLIWKTTLPAFVSVLAYNLYHLADTFFVAKGVGTNAAGGLSVSFPLFLFLSAVTSMLGGGGASVLSRALGEKDEKKANKVIANSFGIFFVTAAFITVSGLIFLEPLLYAVGVTKTLMPYAKAYTRIILSAAVVSTGFSSLIRAEGSSRYAMYIWTIPTGINLLLDPILIIGFHMGISGAAVGTAVSWCVSMAMSIWYFFLSGRRNVRIKIEDFRPDLRLLAEILGIGIPTFLQTAGYSLSVVFVNHILKNHGGTMVISTYGIVSKAYTFLLLGITALMQGIQPIIGYNYGQNKMDRVKETLRKSYWIVSLYGGMTAAVLFFFSHNMISLLTSDPEVIAMGGDILFIMGCGAAFYGVFSVQSVYFQAAGKRWISLFLSLCSHIICLLPAAVAFVGLWGIGGIWYAFPVAGFLSMCISCVLVKWKSV